MIRITEKNLFETLFVCNISLFSILHNVFPREVLAYSGLSSVPPRVFLPEGRNNLSLLFFLGHTDHICHSVILVRTVGNYNILFLLKYMWVLTKISQIEIQQNLPHWDFLKWLWSVSACCSSGGVRSTVSCFYGPKQ